MTSTTSAVEPTVGKPVEDATTPSRARSIPRAGWLVIASKEFGDHILSSRFLVLAIIMTVAAAVPLYFISGQIRDAPSGATGFPALFIALFWLTPSVNDQIQLPSVVGFLALVGPLLGSRSHSMRSTASGRTAPCRACCRSRSTATTSSTANSRRVSE